jgi:hypothetical protein
MLTNKQKKAGLTDLIEMTTPDWLSEEVYQDYMNNFDYYKNELSNPSQFVASIKSLQGVTNVSEPNLQWNYVDVTVTAQFFVDMWDKGRIISPPSTGQDPKSYSKSNYITASEHFANMWGDDIGSLWLREGVLNLVHYPGGRLILEATDIEHRLWGIIGGALGYLPLKSNEELTFKDPSIQREVQPGVFANHIIVNNLTIHQIVDEANKYSDKIISIDDVLNRYFKVGHQFKLRLLPMYSEKECHNFYGILNKQSNKTEAQLLHAKTYDSNFWIKEHSSIKLQRFKAGNFDLHPFYELFDSSLLMKLESFMYSHLLFQNTIKGDFVESTDAKLRTEIENTFGYQKTWESDNVEDIKEQLFQKLDLLYKFYSQIDNPRFSRQAIQQILKSIEWLEEENQVIFDWNLFSNSLYDFVETHRVHQSGPEEGVKTKFGVNMGASNIKDYKCAFTYIKKNFLQEYIVKDKFDSTEIGVITKSDRIPRLFTNEVIDDSEKNHEGKDIDNTPIKGRRVGGHIISDYELVRMTDGERVQSFIDEGLGDKFDFDLNCRAMSSYHNLRMSILRLSEYLSVMNESDEIVKQKIREKKESLKHKSILV